MVRHKGFIYRLTLFEVDVVDPGFRHKGFDQLAEDDPVGKEFLLATVMNRVHVFVDSLGSRPEVSVH